MNHRSDEFEERSGFLIELARRLHTAGVSAARLEGAIQATAKALGVRAEIWSAPTGLLLSLENAESIDAAAQPVTRVLRLQPGQMDFSALSSLNEIADRVIAGKLSVFDARAAMRTLDRVPSRRDNLLQIASHGLAAAAITALLRIAWIDVAVAAILGLLIGWLSAAGRSNEQVVHATEAIAAFVATILAAAFAHFVAPLSVQTVVIASLIVLMPGLTLTTAVVDLAEHQLVTGTTRFAGAVMTLMKLTFGSLAAAQLAGALKFDAASSGAAALPPIVEMVALIFAALALSVSFRTARRDMVLVIGSSILGYVLVRAGTALFDPGSETAFAGAVFFAGIVMAALANVYGRLTNRPGALVRVPGIMLLVPGSAGFRGLSSVLERDYSLGLETAVAVVGALIALAAGILCGSLLVPSRRYL